LSPDFQLVGLVCNDYWFFGSFFLKAARHSHLQPHVVRGNGDSAGNVCSSPHFSQIFAAITDMGMSTASGSVGYLHRPNNLFVVGTSPVSSVAFLVSIPICAISLQYL
jgi:hypothetical protein